MATIAFKNSPLIITGMHRSGTSLTASLLLKAGVNLGENLVGANIGNPKGHFENEAFVAFHQKILRSHHLDELGYAVGQVIPIDPSIQSEAESLLQDQACDQIWGWKDPRTTLFLEFWYSRLPQAYFIFIFRSPWDGVDSLYRRGTDALLWDDPTHAIQMWLDYNRRILQFYRDHSERSLVIHADTIVTHPERLFSAIEQKFTISLPLPSENLVDPELWNKPDLHDRIVQISHYFPEAISIYQELCGLAIEKIDLESVIPLALGSDLGSEISQTLATQTFRDWLSLRRLEKQRDQSQQELQEKQTQLDFVQAELAAQRTELEQIQRSRDLAQAQAQIADFNHHRDRQKLIQIQAEVQAMETSKFWKLRQLWFTLKSRFRVARTEKKEKLPLRVLFCSNALNFTGAPLHQYEIAVALRNQGLIEPIIFSNQEGSLREYYEQQGMCVIAPEQHPLIPVQTLEDYHATLQQLTAVLVEQSLDLVYANTIETFYGIDIAQYLHIPSVWNIHESEPWETYFQRFWFDEAVGNHALGNFQRADRVIFVAHATEQLYRPLQAQNNFQVIHNGVNHQKMADQSIGWTREIARASLNLNPETIALLLLGTVCERKGQQELVMALAELPAIWHDRIHCFIVGDRPSDYSQQLAELITNLPTTLQGRVTLVPETPDTACYYQAADLFICTSRIESYPRVILEAMYYGLPIITTPVFGIQEQVKFGVNALFYEVGNPLALMQAIVAMLENPEQRQEFAKNSRLVLNSLNTFDQMTQAYFSVFQDVCLSHA